MYYRCILIILIFGIGMVLFLGNSHAGCDVDEVLWLVKEKKLSSDQIRQKCKNSVNDVEDCSLSKVIRLAGEGSDQNEIYKECTKKK